uniref:phage portal protein n=1 Tax=Staphylococcus epidermidis TaxID=1282 RepID=UPI00119EC650
KHNLKHLLFTFTPNLPNSITQQIQIYITAGPQITQQTLISLLSFIHNPQHQLKPIHKQQQQNINHSHTFIYNQQHSHNQLNNSNHS